MDVVGADVIVARIHDPAMEGPDSVVIGDTTLAPGTKFWAEFAKQPKREICKATTRASIASLGLSEEVCPSSGIAYYGDGLIQIMHGRGLRSKDVAWGGNPDEPKVHKDGILCPRNSFEKYMQKAKQESKAWSKIDVHVITALSERASEYSHNRMISLLKNDIDAANAKYFTAIEKVRDNCEFFAHMSHEIRTPFHGVMGCLNILNDAKNMSPEEIQEMVNTALASGNHMINLLNDILDISKNKYSSRTNSNNKVSYQVLASEAAHSLKSLAINNGITYNANVQIPEEGNTLILTDRTKVVQVVSNIVNNAIKFSSDGTIDVDIQLTKSLKRAVREVEIKSEQHAGTVFAMQEGEVYDSMNTVKENIGKVKKMMKNQKWMLVSVADSGCGMKPEELAEMLKPYTQASNGTNRKFQGTGLGLFICLSLCQQLNGFISCSSTKCVGSIFQVGIPVGIPDAENQMIDESMDGESAQGDISRKRAREPEPDKIMIDGPIAVVDDNKVNVKILVRSLKTHCEKAGMPDVDLITADGGMEAFELYKEQRPSVLCIDYHMPGTDGIQATLMIREYEAANNLKPCFILSYTADATESTAKKLMANGTDAIMTKPPPKDFLSTLVSRFEFACSH
jgi:chemotaxis family two-component system sensor kinase Cph1